MTATGEGPMSMCLFNAKRDQYILAPQKITTVVGDNIWHPLTGNFTSKANRIYPSTVYSNTQNLPRKKRKGRIKRDHAVKKNTTT
jgi:hypothetical protein